ncbi:hypothetical protein [Rhodopseudomonas palustris]|uniref:Uncharacterized protein n=1 Tax=Rhodopseudomonas palustris TaxID=1076 RepID=A0A418V4D1_RHOPL|nr:hypothetical protein [Rhodopseudomonas palustris]RJF70905.1 hypothetical protein D4Q52_14850 [Rhodopseudomonas palustris]
MTRRRPTDTLTPDLFRDYQPAPVVERFSPERVRAARASARIKQALKEALRDCGRSRDTVAAAMSEYLGERVSPQILDQYTSAANETANIPAHRLIALVVVTGDIRLINALLVDTDAVAVARKYEALIRREMAKEARDRLDREINAADAEWRAGR